MENNEEIPALRFPEFKHVWNVTTINEVGEIVGGGTPDTTVEQYWGGEILWITPTELKTKYIGDSQRKITELGLAKSSAKLLPVGTLLLSTRATVGDIAIAKKEVTTNQGFQSIIVNDSSINEFVYYWVLKNKNLFLEKASGSTFLEVSKTEVKKIKIRIPEKKEQLKIASFLTAVDDKIQQLTKKRALLEQYKKGVMRKLFSHEIRFKDDNGKEFSEWQTSSLSYVGEIIGGGTPDTTKSEYWNGDILWFTPTELKSKYLNDSQRKISHKGLLESSAKLLPVGTLLLSTRATIGDVSIALVECTTNQGFQSIVVNNDNCNEFIYYWLSNNKEALLKKASGSTFLEISKAEIGKLKISLPALKEQEKIAAILKSIDAKVEKVSRQIDKTQEFKRGLLQQMFV